MLLLLTPTESGLFGYQARPLVLRDNAASQAQDGDVLYIPGSAFVAGQFKVADFLYVDPVANTIQVGGDILPTTSNTTRSIGSGAAPFADIYVSELHNVTSLDAGGSPRITMSLTGSTTYAGISTNAALGFPPWILYTPGHIFDTDGEAGKQYSFNSLGTESLWIGTQGASNDVGLGQTTAKFWTNNIQSLSDESLSIKSFKSDGASSVGTVIDTDSSFSTAGSKLLSLRTAGVEKFAVFYDGSITGSGTSTLANLTVTGLSQLDGGIRFDSSNIFGVTRTVPTTVDATVEIGSWDLSGSDGAAHIDVSIAVGGSGVSVSKRFSVPVRYGGSGGAFQIVPPLTNTGAYTGTQDFALEVNSSAATTTLRIRRTLGTLACTARVTMVVTGLKTSAFTPSTTTGTSAVTAPYTQSHAGNISSAVVTTALGYTPSRSATSTNSVYSLDSRAVNSEPDDRDAGLYVDFKSNGTTGLSDGGSFHGLLTFRGYGASTDMSAGSASVQQLGFTQNNNLHLRSSTSGTAWGSWTRILSNANFDDTGHGSRGGAGLHALATTGAHGFMSSTDKTKLDAFGAASTYVLKAGDTMTGALTVPVIEFGRNAAAARGISWYQSSYNTWFDYMSPSGANMGPHGNITAPSGTLVTSWAMRSLVENLSGYGWIWESGANSGTTPSVVAELSSVNGNFRTIGSLTAVNATLSGTLAVTGATTLTGLSSFDGGYKNGPYLGEKVFTAVFSNGVANQAIDIRLGDLTFLGNIEVEITSGYSFAPSYGRLAKLFSVTMSVGGGAITTVGRVTDATGPTSDNFAIGDPSWDATNSTYRIPISHIVSTGNTATVRVRLFAGGSSTYTGNVLNAMTVSSAYTLTALAKQYVSFNGLVGIGTNTPNTNVGLEVIGNGVITSASETDATNKNGRFGSRHYTNAEEPFYFAAGVSTSTANDLSIGGGTSLGNAATDIRFYTAANNSTTTGTERANFGSTGIFSVLSGDVRLAATSGVNQLMIGTSANVASTNDIKFMGSATYTSYADLITRSGGDNGAFDIRHRGTGIMSFYNAEAAPFYWWTSGAEKMRLTSSGVLMVNTLTNTQQQPSSLIEVKGGTGGNLITIYGGTNLATEASYFLAQNRAQFGYNGNEVFIGDAGTTKSLNITLGGSQRLGINNTTGALTLTGTIDTIASNTLDIGTTTASSLSLSKSGSTTTINGSAIVVQTLRANSHDSTNGLNAITIGGTDATGITLGRTGLTVTVPGALSVTGAASAAGFSTSGDVAVGGMVYTDYIRSNTATTLTIADSVSTGVSIGQSGHVVNIPGQVTIGNGLYIGTQPLFLGGDAATSGAVGAVYGLNTRYQYWNGSSQFTNGYAISAAPTSNAAGVGDLAFYDAGSTERLRLKASSGDLQIVGGALKANTIDARTATTLAIGGTTATSVTLGNTANTTTINGTTVSLSGGTGAITAHIGAATTSGDVTLHIGQATNNNSNTYIDLINNQYSDYAVRLIRATGTNGVTQLTHRGTGAMEFYNQENANFNWYTSSAERMRLATDGNLVLWDGYLITYEGAINTQQIMSAYGWNNSIPRWKNVLEADAAYSLWSYDSAGASAAQRFTISNSTGNATFYKDLLGSIAGTTTSAPRLWGPASAASGEAFRFQLADGNNYFQSGFGQKVQLSSYHGIDLVGAHGGSPPGFVSGGWINDSSVRILGNNNSAPLEVQNGNPIIDGIINQNYGMVFEGRTVHQSQQQHGSTVGLVFTGDTAITVGNSNSVGTNAVTNVADALSRHRRGILMTTGAAFSGNNSYLHTSSPICYWDNHMDWQATIRATSSTTGYSCGIGAVNDANLLNNGLTPGASGGFRGYYFVASSSTNGTRTVANRWYAGASLSNADTFVDTGVNVSTTAVVTFGCRRSYNGSTQVVKYYINGILVATITTNIPTGTTEECYLQCAIKTLDASAKSMAWLGWQYGL